LKLLTPLEEEPLSSAENAANEGVFGDCKNIREQEAADEAGQF
jgi:hypothetical protein